MLGFDVFVNVYYFYQERVLFHFYKGMWVYILNIYDSAFFAIETQSFKD